MRCLWPLLVICSLESQMPDDRYGCNFMISYTLWVAREANLGVSYGGISTGSVVTDDDMVLDSGMILTDTLIPYPQVDPRSGFKLGATYMDDNLELACSYTWFYNRDNSYMLAEASEDSAILSLATWSLDGTPSSALFNAEGLSTSWNNSFNRIDATLCGTYHIGDCLLLRPFLGMVFAWDNQDFMVSYRCLANKITEWNNTQEWYGIGPYLGISPSYIIWMCKDSCNSHSLSIFGKGGLSLAWSRSNTKMRQFVGESSFTEKASPTNTYREIFYYVSPMVESSLGFSWDGRYDGWTSMASISWDIEAWFSHNHMFDISRYYSRRGVYSMQGLTLTGGFGF